MRSCLIALYGALRSIHPGLLALALVSSAAVAQSTEIAPLDPPYPVQIPTAQELAEAEEYESNARFTLPSRSDFEAALEFHTPVKSQQNRGTCSMFSDIAMLEAMLIRQGYVAEGETADLDLSEEWLQYVATRYQTSDGSHSTKNFSSIVENGFLTEEDAPYIGEEWKAPLHGLARTRCGMLGGVRLASCLIGHWNPDLLTTPWSVLTNPQSGVLHDPHFLRLRNRAHELRREYIESNVEGRFNVWSRMEAKRLLSEGVPLSMGMTVYYGAWNHSIATKLQIGRNMEHWHAGIVGHPEPGSVDFRRSKEEAAGHSVLLVGYDDDVVVETTVKMNDGSVRNFRYRGVYYFKNSWGTTAFGRDFTVGGERFPGYGMITQKYVHQYGSFYRFPLRAR